MVPFQQQDDNGTLSSQEDYFGTSLRKITAWSLQWKKQLAGKAFCFPFAAEALKKNKKTLLIWVKKPGTFLADLDLWCSEMKI